MKVEECEKAVLGIILSSPDSNAVSRICSELDSDKFSSIGHRLIYSGIQNLVIRGQVPNTLNVTNELGQNSEAAGGLPYLQSLISFVKMLNISSGSDGSYESWVRIIDAAGRLRHVGLIVNKYSSMYEDFDRLLTDVKDPDDFISNFMVEINQGLGGVRTSYRHISEATADLRRRLEIVEAGGTFDLIPTGWPGLEKYFIPRPFSLGVVAGLPSMGKTQLAFQIGLGAAIFLYENSAPGIVSINSLETVAWRVANRLACCLAGVDSDDLDSGRLFEDKQSRTKYYDTLDYIDQLPIEYDDNPDISSRGVLWQAIAQHNMHGPRVLGITDYLQLLKDDAPSEELRVSGAIKNQKLISRETGSCEISITPFNNSVLLSNDKMGNLSRARYSGIIDYDADWGIIVYNPPQMTRRNIKFTLPDGFSSDLAYGIVEKNRDHKLGRVEFAWIPDHTQFRDLQVPMGMLYRKNGHHVASDF